VRGRLWYLMPLSTIFQLYRGGVPVENERNFMTKEIISIFAL
jgi:hypothetical protein